MRTRIAPQPRRRPPWYYLCQRTTGPASFWRDTAGVVSRTRRRIVTLVVVRQKRSSGRHGITCGKTGQSSGQQDLFLTHRHERAAQQQSDLSSWVPAAQVQEQPRSSRPGRPRQGCRARTWTKSGHSGFLWDNSGGGRNNRRPATQRAPQKNTLHKHISQMGAFLFRGTHVGHRTAAVGAVCQLAAGGLGGTLGLIWTGDCGDRSEPSPSVEEELCVPLQPPPPQSSL